MFANSFERILPNKVNEVKTNESVTGTQFGFRKHKSPTGAVLHLIEALQEHYDKLKISIAVFNDLAEAFIAISNKIFLRKIEAYCFSESVIDLFASLF